jgi:hypothetical protein
MLDWMRERRALLVVVTLLVLAVGAGAWALLSGSDDDTPSGTSQRGGQLRGFHYTAWFDDSDATIQRRLDDVRAAGGNAIRVPFNWPTYEPRPRQIDNDALDRFAKLVAEAGRRGIKVIWMLGGTPCEYAEIPSDLLTRCREALVLNRKAASRNPDFITWPPEDEAAWRNSLRLVLDKVGDQLAAAEVWNEPNKGAFFHTSGNRAEDYVRIVRWTADEIHQRTPGLPVLAGSIANADVPFLDELYAKGARRHRRRHRGASVQLSPVARQRRDPPRHGDLRSRPLSRLPQRNRRDLQHDARSRRRRQADLGHRVRVARL